MIQKRIVHYRIVCSKVLMVGWTDIRQNLKHRCLTFKASTKSNCAYA